MNDYKHLVNKNCRERDQDMTQYHWETSSKRDRLYLVCGYLVVAAIFLACLIGWVEEAHADAPRIYSQDGRYLGNLSTNRYDANSINNPYGRYGSRYSSDSVNNPYGRYGSRYSNESANNPYATQAPVIFAPSTYGFGR